MIQGFLISMDIHERSHVTKNLTTLFQTYDVRVVESDESQVYRSIITVYFRIANPISKTETDLLFRMLPNNLKPVFTEW